MGHYAYLAGSAIDRAPANDADWAAIRALPGREMSAKYYVPFTWLALFEVADLRNDVESEDPYLIAPQAVALARFDRRRAGLARYVGDAFVKLVDQFRFLVATELGPFVMLRLSDLAAMSGPGEYEAEIRDALDAAACLDLPGPLPRTARDAIRRACSLDETWRTHQFAVGLIVGYADDWPPSPELEAWQTGMATATGEPRMFDPTIVWKVGEVVRHLMYGDGFVRKLEGTKTEVVFAHGPVMFGRVAKAGPDPYGPTTPLGRFLHEPSDVNWRACLEAMPSTDRTRAALMQLSRDRAVDLTEALDDGRTVGDVAKKLVGPLARIIDDGWMRFRRGFLYEANLRAPGSTRRGPILRPLGGSGEALLEHPLWRTVESIQADRGVDDDVIRVVTHPNFISLRHTALSAAGLATLARHTEPLAIEVVDLTDSASKPLASQIASIRSIGAIGRLVELKLQQDTVAPDDFAWLVETPLGRQLQRMRIYTYGETPPPLAAWHAALLAHPSLAYVALPIRHERSTSTFVLGRDTLRIITGARFDDGLALADTMRPALDGLPRTLHATLHPEQVPKLPSNADLQAFIGALRAHLDEVVLGTPVAASADVFA